MSIPAWPSELPQNILAQGYKGGLPNNLLRQPMGVGPAKVRRRGTVAVEPVTGNILCTPTELAALITFYETTLLDGSLRFRWVDPLTGDTTTTVGSITGATLNLSLVDGLAFISNPSTDLTPYLGCKLTLTDSAGKKAIGYIKAAGTGETLSEELVDAWTNHPIDTYETFTPGVGNLITQAVNSAGNGSCFKGIANSAGKVFKNTNAITVNSGTIPWVTMSQYATGQVAGIKFTANATSYRTATGTTSAVFALVVDNFSSDFALTAYSSKQLLTPSATGVTITSTPGGTTYNWASIESGFNYNDASGYTYTIVPRFVGGGLGMGIIYGF